MRAPGLIVLAVVLALSAARPVAAGAPAPPARPAPAAEAEFPALQALEREVSRLIETTRPSVVGVIARSDLAGLLDPLGDKLRIEDGGRRDPFGHIARRIGSGIVLDSQGHIATLASLVVGATEVIVIPQTGGRMSATLTGVDQFTGLAVVKTEASTGLEPVDFGDSDTLRIGSIVTAVTSPSAGAARSPLYSVGVVSGTGVAGGPTPGGTYLRLEAYSAPGAGGAPVFDTKGRLVGLVFAAKGRDRRHAESIITWETPEPDPARTAEEAAGAAEEAEADPEADLPTRILRAMRPPGSAGGDVTFAVPSNVVRSVADRLIRSGSVERGWVGVKIEESEPGEIVLLSVVPGGPADKAGLKTGDRILSLDGDELDDSGTLVDTLAARAPGETVRLGIRRGDRPMEMSVVLGRAARRTQPWGVPDLSPQTFTLLHRSPPALGVVLDVDTAGEARVKAGSDPEVGLLVLEVHANSRAQRAGIRPGDLLVEALGHPIRVLPDLRRALRAQGPETMQVKVLRDRDRLVLKVPPALPEPPTPPPAPAPPAPPRRPPRRAP